MMQEATEANIRKRLVSGLLSLPDMDGRASEVPLYNTDISDDEFDQVKFQLFALGLIAKGKIKRAVADRGVYWCLSPYGEGYLMRLRALKRP